MNSVNIPKSVIINYYECNIDSIWMSIIIVIIMIFFLIFLKIILYSYIYKIHRVCHPIPFFFGEQNSCKQIIYSVKSQQLKHIAEEKSKYNIKVRNEEIEREQQQTIINQITIDKERKKEEDKSIYEEKKRIENIQKRKENESCDNVIVEENFTNYTSSEMKIQDRLLYILAMYKTMNLNIVGIIEKMKRILYILFNEYVYPKLTL